MLTIKHCGDKKSICTIILYKNFGILCFWVSPEMWVLHIESRQWFWSHQFGGGAIVDSFEKLTAPSLKELFVNKIAGLILSGKLKIGERFPAERTLAEQMGVGKTVVHAGLQELSRMGLVTIKPQSGVYVADFMRDGNLETFNAIVRFNGDNLSLETIAGLFDLRHAVEGYAMLRLAQKHTREDISKLRDCIAMLGDYAASADFGYATFARKLYDFPKLICRLGGCNMLALVFNSVEEGAVSLTERYVISIGTASAINELVGFADLIESGDGEAAVKKLRDCMNSQLERYERGNKA